MCLSGLEDLRIGHVEVHGSWRIPLESDRVTIGNAPENDVPL